MEFTDLLLVLFLILIYAFQSLSIKCFSLYYPGAAENSSPIFTIVSGVTVAVVTLAVIGFQFAASPLTVILAAVNSLALVMYNTSFMKASGLGPYSVSMVFSIAGGILLPTVSAAVTPLAVKALGDPVIPSLVKIISVLVVLGAVYLVSRKAGETYTNKKLYFIYAMGIAVSNGIYGALMDAQQKLTGVEEKEEMAIMSYLFAGIISAVMLLIKEKKNFLPTFRQSRGSLFFLLLGAAMITLAVNLLGVLLGIVNVTVLYTMNNAGVFVFSILFSYILFKEKLTKLNIIGILIVCAGLVGVAF